MSDKTILLIPEYCQVQLKLQPTTTELSLALISFFFLQQTTPPGVVVIAQLQL